MEKTCLRCGTAFKTKPSHYPRRRFCSVTCSHENRRERIVKSCPQCHKDFEVVASRKDHGRGVFCSAACQYAAARAAPSKKVSRKCFGCGSDFEVYPSVLKSPGGGTYCSRSCRDKNRTGKAHPQYLTGSASDKRGPNWQSQKRKALARDGRTCQACGTTESEIQTPLQVHHIEPFRKFKDFREANVLTNLVTLCPKCHRRADAAIQRKERECS